MTKKSWIYYIFLVKNENFRSKIKATKFSSQKTSKFSTYKFFRTNNFQILNLQIFQTKKKTFQNLNFNIQDFPSWKTSHPKFCKHAKKSQKPKNAFKQTEHQNVGPKIETFKKGYPFSSLLLSFTNCSHPTPMNGRWLISRFNSLMPSFQSERAGERNGQLKRKIRAQKIHEQKRAKKDGFWNFCDVKFKWNFVDKKFWAGKIVMMQN
jgi:hypothetical protein